MSSEQCITEQPGITKFGEQINNNNKENNKNNQNCCFCFDCSNFHCGDCDCGNCCTNCLPKDCMECLGNICCCCSLYPNCCTFSDIDWCHEEHGSCGGILKICFCLICCFVDK